MHNEELVDKLDLIIDTKRPLGQMTQETARMHPSALIPAHQALERTF
jgi:hypothetical protein